MSATHPSERTGGVGTAAPHPGERTLLSYLLIPRPNDLVKASVLPLGFCVGAVAAGGIDGTAAVRALVVWVALELLIYQARYQWNDIRGFAADQAHPDRGARGRLPGPLAKGPLHRRLSAGVAIARLGVAAALPFLLPGLHLGGTLAAVAASALGIAALYEVVRSAATGRASSVPPPLRPAVLALWAVVGAGYAVRAVAGLALAVDLGQRPELAAVAIVASWAAGVAFVMSRWAVETLAFARLDGHRVTWEAQQEQAREHTLALLRWVTRTVDPRDLFGGRELANWRPLHGPTPLVAPWNAASVVAGAAGALTGRLLVAPAAPVEAALTAAGGAVAAAAVVLVARRRAAAALITGAAFLVALSVVDTPRPAVVVLPWAAAAVVHVSATSRSPRELSRPLRRLSPLLARVRRDGAGRSSSVGSTSLDGRPYDSPAASTVSGSTSR